MKVLSVLSAAAALGAVSGFQDVRKNFKGDRVIEVHPEHLTENIRALLDHHEGDHIGFSEENHFSIKLNPASVEALEKEGLQFKDSTEEWIAKLQENLDDPNLFCTDGVEECASRDMQTFYSQYQDLDAIIARIEDLVDASSLATMKVIGSTSEGRDLNLVEIGDQTKPLAYFMCNVHAREWLTPMFCTYMIENLLADGGHRLLDTFSFAVIPSGNPDGYTYSRTTDNMWRKTRNTNSGSSCIGTDPNRNYDDHHCGSGTSSNPCSEVYCGPAPFSTPETAAINAYAAQSSVSSRLITWTDFHSYGGYWLSPLGYASGTPPAVDYDRMLECMTAAKNAVAAETGQNFAVGGAANLLGAAAGASDDYFYFAYDVIYSFTCEMRGSSFQPSTSNIDPSNREIFAGMVAQLDCIEGNELVPTAAPVPTTPTTTPPTPAPTPSCIFFC